MNSPAVSIIVPVFNVELYISDCLQSVMRQTYQGPVECILVDDCGTDGSMAIVEQLIADYRGPIRFKILHHEHNRGLSAARNTGTDIATGDYVYYLDSDDYISNECLEVLSQPLRERDYDVVLGNLEMFGNPKDIVFLPKETGAIIGNENVFKEIYVNRMIYVMAWNKLVKRSLFQKKDLTFLEGQLHEDELWTYKLAISAESMFVQHKTTYYYRIRENGIMASFGKNAKKRLSSCYDTMDYVLRHPAPVSKECYDSCVVYYFGVYLRTIYGDLDFRDDYIKLRRRFEYHPLRLFVRGKLSLVELKHGFHFALPPFLGYQYLVLRRRKNQSIR